MEKRKEKSIGKGAGWKLEDLQPWKLNTVLLQKQSERFQWCLYQRKGHRPCKKASSEGL